MNDDKPNLDLAYALETVQDNRELYASWACDYDKDFASAMDYILPNQVAQIFLNMGGTGPVLDVGAGTGDENKSLECAADHASANHVVGSNLRLTPRVGSRHQGGFQ